ncbi:YegS/Rv2252/BmrU family lipid kinase [Flavobacterium sp. MC2016-06]|uniref:diacylglycerol/lipid kinase family protein n=1 Tax=Flavobacterium sp. MC2016-06 TaxID=2676308 RepID=UPI0012BAB59E|nr:YegS/Rv2252/BmrU family lipid kinase [Flavobacterium sp. MC2016-06]MBU3857560.1 YegS/Rv2252/BmrU family lipid kinase [Flavobacterium sp. MC2016-06]
MTYIHFVINPISGKGKHNISLPFLKSCFPESEYRIEAAYTKHKKHAIELVQKIVAENPHYIVACGGDGTINEVASCLIGTKIKLGIIPVGSGNGLASNLNIPRDIKDAVEIIKAGKDISMDVGKVNEHYFFSNMGIGIDSMIIKKYEQSGNRTLLAYIKASIFSSIEFKPRVSVLFFDNKVVRTKPLILFVSNSNEMGYNMSLTPKASLTDGWLDLVVIPHLSFLEKITLGIKVLTNKIQDFKKAEHSLIKSLIIEVPEAIYLDTQIDGESYNLKTNILNISLIEKGLCVLVD